ncbi:Zinc finger protein 507 [Mizuhopecten yessoensis]|uniref:Zinc finger protein 507 n=1 Tax=Mizuhopecten yessoensis TaxID=6573 RepID=A0A210PE99_MIZYE|nr:Zinc finger protein 507 [Mizuhopecten yessoensis]
MEVCTPLNDAVKQSATGIKINPDSQQFSPNQMASSRSSQTIKQLTPQSDSRKRSDNGDKISVTFSSSASVMNPGATRPKLLAELTSVRAKQLAAHSLPGGASRTLTVGQEKAGRSESPIIIIENISKVFPVPLNSHGQKTVHNLIPSESQLTLSKKATSQSSTPVKRTTIQVTSSTSPDHNIKHQDAALTDSNRTAKETFKCEECEYTSYNKHYLKQHVDLVHHADRPFKCPFCDYAGKRSHSLREHLIVHSNERPYECTHCNATFRKKGHLTNHTKLHQKTVFCNTCRKSIIHAELEAHVKTCRARENVFVCELCSFVAPDENAILEHIKVHQSQQIYVCSTCKHMTSDFEAFVAHAETHQQTSSNTDSSTAELKSASIKADLKQTILSKRPHDLEQGKESPVSKVRPVPAATSQPGKQDLLLKCSECGFVAPTTTLMKNHMWTHLQSMENPSPSFKEEVTSQKPAIERLPPQEKSVYKCVECDFMCAKSSSATTPSASVPATVTSTGKEPASPFAIRQDLKESILAKQQKLPAIQDYLIKSKDGELPPFVHDRVNARYLCTICGYSCEFQRTIKAHIWKHSGNQDIEYPMFQNGPLSIYDSAVESKSCLNLTPSSVFMMEKAQKALKENTKEPNTKVSTSQHTSVSPIAPALAHLLAARAMTGLTQEVTLPKVTESEVKSQSDVQDSKEETEINSDFISKPTVKPASKISQGEDAETIPSETDAESSPTKTSDVLGTAKENEQDDDHLTTSNTAPAETVSVGNDDEEPMDTTSMTQETSEDSVDKSDAEKQDDTSPKTSGSAQGQNGAKKRKLSESKYDVNEMLQMVKLFCAAEDVECEDVVEQGNVVVETVDCVVNLSGLTSIKSQQSSPRTCSGITGSTEGEITGETEQDMECGDSGFMSDTNSSQSQATSKVEHAYMSTRSSSRQLERLKKNVSNSPKSKHKEGIEHATKEASGSGKHQEKVRKDEAQNRNCAENEDLEEHDEEEEDIPPSSMAESAVTLLSLLKKGANHNPACPSSAQKVKDEQSEVTRTKGDITKEKKPKSQGISSSLLAVIEQLRERARTETDYDIESGKKGTKKKSRRLSAEDEGPMEKMDNVERIEEAEEDESRFRCKLCHYSNSSTFVMKQHMRLHKTKRPFECSLCDFMAESSEDLQNHMIKHCKVRTYQCKLCPSAFNYKSQLRAHMRAHNEKDVFACEECDFETGNPNLLRNHMSNCHEVKQYVCEVCERRFVSKHQLRVHKKIMCNGEEEMPLMLCPDENGKETQDQKSHGKFQKQDFRCAKCDYVTNSFARFGNHMKTHEEPKVLKCELCDFPAVSNRSLKSHMKRHINDQRFVQQPLEQYKCNLCGYVCHHLPSLKSHMWRHASDQNYSYEFTNEVINAAIDYDSRLDTKECCEEDVAEFNKTIREKMRIRLASQGVTKDAESLCAVCWVTFRCCQCGFEVINKAQLNLHMKTHSDVIQWTLQVSQNSTTSSGTSGGQSSAITVDSGEGSSHVKQRPDRKGLEIQ